MHCTGDLYFHVQFGSRKIEQHLMAHVIMRLSDVKFVTSDDCKSCFQVKINGPIIANPGIQPHTRLAIFS